MTKSARLNIFNFISILFFGILISIVFLVSATFSAKANSLDDIIYPVSELGSCADKGECKLYCDNIEHVNECVAFAQEHNLMSKREIKAARKFAKMNIRKGPGNCTTHEQCENYCENSNNIEECLAFAETHDMISKEELKKARQVAKALRDGVELLGGCTSKESCKDYCKDSAHLDECVSFAGKAGFMNEKELKEVKRILPLMKSGQMPGGCTSKEQCEEYCEDDNHLGECVEFAEKVGLMSGNEASMFRTTDGKGPGGCRGRDECEAYCEDINNQDACLAFAQKHNLISDEDLSNMKKGIVRVKEGLKHASEEVITCIRNRVGVNTVKDIENGTFSPSGKSGEGINRCFEEHMKRRNFQPEVERCIIKIYGEDAIDKLESGELNNDEIGRGIGPCVSGLMKERSGGVENEHMMEFNEESYNIEIRKMPSGNMMEKEKDRIKNKVRIDSEERREDVLFENRNIKSRPNFPTTSDVELNFQPQGEECLIKLYGSNFKEKLMSAEINPNTIKESISKCIEENIRMQQLHTSTILNALDRFLSD